jgi:hypothetical protein
MQRAIAEVVLHHPGGKAARSWTFEQFERERPEQARKLRQALANPPADLSRNVIALPLIERGEVVGVFRALTRLLH